MFHYPHDHAEIRDAVTRLCADFDNKYWQACDADRAYPTDFVRALTDAGYLSALIPEEYGGSGLTYDEYVTIISKVSQTCGSIGLSLAAHNSQCTVHKLKFGNVLQK